MRNHRFPYASENFDAFCIRPIVTCFKQKNGIRMTPSSSTDSTNLKILTEHASAKKMNICISAYNCFFSQRICTHIVNVTSLNWRLGQKVDGFKLNSLLFDGFGTFLRPKLVLCLEDTFG